MSLSTYIFDIQKGSIHDGPGIRTTVFMKGCPLKCDWCHNPESQKIYPQLSFLQNKCIGCGNCMNVCDKDVHIISKYKKGFRHTIIYNNCDAINCSKCIDVCPTRAIFIYGNYMSTDEVFEIVKRDIPFFEHSGGGITVSGGEPLLNFEFTCELLKKCKDEDIHTCVETSGYSTKNVFIQVSEVTDLFLFDWKVSNNYDSLKYIGVELEKILDNINYTKEINKPVILRCPIIPGVNDNEDHFNHIAELCKENPNIIRAELLPYHSIGTSKANNIGVNQTKFNVPLIDEQNKWLKYFNQINFNNIIIAK